MAHKEVEIIVVYQDCILCGDRGRKKVAEFAKRGIYIRKVGFSTPEGSDLIHKAVMKHKIGSMPFFTDGERFDVSISGLLKKIDEAAQKPVQKPKKSTRRKRKSTKKVKEATDGSNSKA